MKYQHPRLFDLKSHGLADAACMDGSNPTYGICSCASGGSAAHSQGAGCNDGCTAANRCANGTDAGFLGVPQGCFNGVAAKQNTDLDGCTTGYGVTDTPGAIGGCMNGYSAFGCSNGSNRFIACIAGATDS